MNVDQLNVMLLIGAGVVLAAIIAARLSLRLGLPSLLLYLALGLLVGESGLGVQFENEQLAQVLGLVALAIILSEGGLTTDWAQMRPTVPLGGVLATVGVVVSAGITGTLTHLITGLDWQLSLLLGAILSSTDAAAVFSMLRRLPLPPRLGGTLESESGFNDPPAVILVTLLSTAPQQLGDIPMIAASVVYQLTVGAAMGLAVGPLGAYALRRVALPASGLYPIAVFTLTVGAFAGASLLNASGLLAAYVAGLVLGNSRLPHGPATRGFAEGVAWVAQIGLFVMLGLLASPSELPSQILPAIVVGFVLLLVARPVSVLVCALPFRLPWLQQAFLSWAGLRGAVPIVLATFPITSGIPGAEQMFALVFVLVVVFTLLQGPSLPWVARWLRVSNSNEPRELEVEAAPLGELGAELLQVRIPPESKMQGVEVFELRLPQDASVTLVVREGHGFVPAQTTALQAGDELLVVTTEAARDATERRLRAVGRRGKLAGWFGEHGG